MFLDTAFDYDEDVHPFIKNGILIDTSVIKIIIDGLVSMRISKRRLDDLSSYKTLLDFLDIIKVNNKWSKLFITPHVLTEVCTHFRNDYNKYANYKEIVKEVLPIIENMGEQSVNKDDIIGRIDFQNPIIEVGDISIFVAAERLLNNNGEHKTAILAKDRGLNDKYRNNPSVLVMDYENVILNRL